MKLRNNQLQKFRPLLEVMTIASISFVIHQLILTFFYPNIQEKFHYSIAAIYSFFVLCSITIVLILLKMKEKNIDSVGNIFLLLTCIKMAISYIIVLPILQNITKEAQLEKFNFFVAFALFLTIETIVTIRILNKKQ
jgi:hypothetical protein